MQCLYCDSQVTPYPSDGICPHCGAKLRPDDTPTWQSYSAPTPVQMPRYAPPSLCCGRCRSTAVTVRKRGFGWAAGLIGFFFFPPFGLLFGLIGRNKQRYRCNTCSHKW